MRRGPVVHGVLLVGALGLAYQGWTRDRSAKAPRGDVVVWEGAPADVQAVMYDTERKTVKVERRPDPDGPGGSYLWGTVTRTTPPPKPKPPVVKDGGPVEEPTPVTPAEPKITTTEFPVGSAGDELFKSLMPLRAQRDLGVPDEATKAEYKLAESKETLTVQLASGSRALLVGGRVYGGEDRYVLDPESGHAYIIPGAALRPIEGADSSLRERSLHAYKPDEVVQAVVKSPAQERTLVRGAPAAPAAPGRPALASWSDAATPDQPDQTLANFMDRVEKLNPMDFDPKQTVEGLTLVVRVEYRGKAGATLGFVELLKRPAVAPTADTQFDYFVRSERTRVLGKVNKLSAERVNQDLLQIFGGGGGAEEAPPAPTTP